MNIKVRPLNAQNRQNIEEKMLNDGWTLTDQEGCIVARHENVKDQNSARTKLQEIDLLISPLAVIQIG